MEKEVPGKGDEEEEGYGKKSALHPPGVKRRKGKNKDSNSGEYMDVYALNKKKAYDKDDVECDLKPG